MSTPVTVTVKLALDQQSLSALNPVGTAAKNVRQQATGGVGPTGFMGSGYWGGGTSSIQPSGWRSISSSGIINQDGSQQSYGYNRKMAGAWDQFALDAISGGGGASSSGWGGGREEKVAKLAKEAGKAADGLQRLENKTHGVVASLEKFVLTLAMTGSLGGAAGSGASGMLGGAGKWFKGLGMGGMATGAGIALGAGLIGHGLSVGQESGQSYLGGIHQLRADVIGGGKVNSRGNWISQDRQMDNLQYRFSESMRRVSMQAPTEAIEAEGRQRQFGNQQSMYGATIPYSSVVGNPFVRSGMSSEYQQNMSGTMGAISRSIMGASTNSAISQYDVTAMSQQVQARGDAYGYAKSGLVSELNQNAMKRGMAQREMGAAQADYQHFSDARQGGDKNRITDQMTAQAERYIKALEEMKRLEEDRVSIEQKLANLTNSQLKDQVDMVRARKEQVNSQLRSEVGGYQGSLENYALMNPGERSYLKNVAKRGKEKGYDALTADEQRMLLNTPLGEDVKKHGRDKFGEEYADLFYKGSSQEKRINSLGESAKELEQLQVKIQAQYDATVVADADEFAKRILERLAPWVSAVEMKLDKLTADKKQQQTDKDQLSGQKTQGIGATGTFLDVFR